jgi:hypothetical protein
MTLALIGALLVLAVPVFMAAQPLWRERLSSVRRADQGLGRGRATP